MKAIILAAGYATRLRPLTETIAKPLLPIAGRPMIDYIYDKIAEVTEVTDVYVVTNAIFAPSFARWAEAHQGRVPVHVINDGTRSNEDRLGAIGDIAFTIDTAGLVGDDLLIIAGDNLFDYDLRGFMRFFHDKGFGSAVVLYRCPDRELVKQYSVVERDESDRLISFVEKPKEPTSDLVAVATYIYHREHVPLIRRYLDEGNPPDQPGNLVAWMLKRVPVYGYEVSGLWLDIGSAKELLHADNLMRQRASLPTREAYLPE